MKKNGLLERYKVFLKEHKRMDKAGLDLAFARMLMCEFAYSEPRIAAFLQKHGIGHTGNSKYGKKVVKQIEQEEAYQEARKAYLNSFYPNNPENIMRL